MPPNTTICRLCLSADIRTIAIADTPLQLVYEKLTNNLLHTADMRPVAACYLCHTQLSKSYKLMLTSAKAENILTEILETCPELTNESIAMKDSPSHSLYGSLAVKVGESTDSLEPICLEIKLEPVIEEFDVPCSPGMASSDKEYEKYEPEVQVEKVDVEEHDDDPLNWSIAEPSRTKRKKVKVESEEVGASTKKFEYELQIEDSGNGKHQSQRDPRSQTAEKCVSLKHEPNNDGEEKCGEKLNIKYQSKKINDVESSECSIGKHCLDRKKTFPNHLLQHYGEKPYECHICQRRFSLQKNLKIHFAAHARKKPSLYAKAKPSTLKEKLSDILSYQCDICHKVFDHKSNLRIHLKCHSENRPHQCHACDRAFGTKHALTVHLRIHSGEKPYECDVCHQKFNSSSSFYRHVKIHTGEKPHECEVCKRRFSQLSNLKSHVKLHTGEKPYECTICHNRFFTKHHMLRHLTTHTGERPYECSVCQRRFSRDTHLKRHVKIHTGDKSHVCQICHRSFIESADLKKHMRTHTGEKPFECKVCQRRFKLKGSMIKHMAKHTSGKSGASKNIPETT